MNPGASSENQDFKFSWKHLKRLTRRSISKQILAAILIISSVLTTLITLFQLGYDYRQDVKVIENSLDLVGEAYTKSIASSLWEFHQMRLQTDLEGILTIPGIRYAQINSPQSRIVLESGILPVSRTLSRTFPLKYQTSADRSVDLGELTVVADLDIVLHRIYNKVLLIFATQFIKTLIISFAIYFAIQSILTKHLIDITTYLKKLNFSSTLLPLRLSRKKSPAADLNDHDELDTLVDSINQMQDNLLLSYEKLAQLNLQLEKRVEENTRLIVEQRQKLEYASKMQSLGEMAGGIAHEINSPLTTITLATDMLMDLEKSPEIDRAFLARTSHTIQKTVHRIAQIIQGMRNFARDGSRDPMQIASVKDIVMESLMLCQEKIKKSNVQLRHSEIPEDVMISCRQVEISQVLLNLLNNATEAASACNDKWIELTCQISSSEVLLAITDCGPGIPVEIRENIFQPFFTTKDVGKGTGLGLSISLGIIENHGGTLQIDETNPNTSFVISLPRAFKVKSEQPLPISI